MISVVTVLLFQFATPARAAIDHDNDRIATGRLCTQCEQKYVQDRVFAKDPVQQYAELQEQKAATPDAPSGTETSK